MSSTAAQPRLKATIFQLMVISLKGALFTDASPMCVSVQGRRCKCSIGEFIIPGGYWFIISFTNLFAVLIRIFSAFDEQHYDDNNKYKSYYCTYCYQNFPMRPLVNRDVSIMPVFSNWIWKDFCCYALK